MNAIALPVPAPSTRDLRDARNDRLFRWVLIATVILVLVALACAALSMLWGGRHALQEQGLSFFYSSEWNPVENKFGALAPIYGTLVTALIAMVIAVPVSFGIAFFLTEVAPRWLRGPVGTAIELLAGIPSIIYGMWGLFVLVPVMTEYVTPFLNDHLGTLPIIGPLFQGPPLGIGVLTAGFVLAIMVIPFISSVMREVFLTVPTRLKESAYALGSTKWEVSWDIVLPYTRSAVIGGIFLGLGRALGETMAVAFVIGNSVRLRLRRGYRNLPLGAAAARLRAVHRDLRGAGHRPPDADAPGPQGGQLMSTANAQPLYLRRRIVNVVALLMSCLTALFGLFFLGWILLTLASKGLAGINLDLFTKMTPPPMQEGGLANAFFGSAVMCGLAIAIGTPLGVLAGTWLAEYGNFRKTGTVVRFVNDILLSAPSIVLGLFVYTLYVMQTGGQFSAFAGALSLAFIVLPVVVRTTDEMLRLVPSQMREAALSLGIPQWKVTVQVLYRSAAAGIVTGILLALARISGETAPLLFTAFGNQYWNNNVFQPMASVPVVMNQFAGSPYESWQTLAWAGALVLTVFVLLVSLSARGILLRNRISHD
jgi:phosphate transport system permease protein